MQDVVEAMTRAIVEKAPDAEVRIDAHGGGHFTVEVTSNAFAGLSRVDAQRLVLSSIAPLMGGDSAPVHAIDKLTTKTR